MANEKLFHVGVKALLQKPNGTILVMKAGPFKENEAHWDLPGGRMQENESAEDTLSREIEEETGLRSTAEPRYFGSCISNIQIPLDSGTVGLVLIAYIVDIDEDIEIALSDEHTQFDWVTVQEAAERLAYKYPRSFTDLLA